MTITRASYVVPILLTILSFEPLADPENGCIACHKSEDFYARQPKLHRYYQDWVKSLHSQVGVTCDDCHGGDASAAGEEQAHDGVFPVNDPRSLLHYTRQPETCGTCHQDKQSQFQESKHFGALMTQQGAAPTCTTCHPAMNKRPTYHNIVLNACRSCHAPGNRQGLPAVADQAETLLRHVNMAEGLLGWTNLHYAARQWPGDSRKRVLSLEKRYQDIVSRIHRFDLAASEQATINLLDDLRSIFDAEKRAMQGGTATAP